MSTLDVLNDRLKRRISVFEELGGLSSIVVQNKEWLYMLTEETRNSLSIEGHFASEAELRAVIQGKKTYPEVLNYYTTAQSMYDFALQRHRENENALLDVATIKHIHSLLFLGVLEARGTFRVGAIQIQRAKVKPPAMDIQDYITAFVEFCRRELNSQEELVRTLARIHTLFESIHPFQDGNGRTGRILLNYLAIASGLPAIIIKGFTDDDREKYYKALEFADQGMHAEFPEPTAEAFTRALNVGDSDELQRLIYDSLIQTIDPLIAAALERREELVDLPTLAVRMSVKESTVRKWRQRQQLITLRRGKKYYSHPLLYLGESGMSSRESADIRLRQVIEEIRPRVRAVDIDADGLGATFFSERVSRIYVTNTARPTEPTQFAIFAHPLVLDTADLGQPPLEDAPHVNVTNWTDDEIADFVRFPEEQSEETEVRSHYERQARIEEHVASAFYPLVSMLGIARLTLMPLAYVSARLPLSELKKLVAQSRVTMGDFSFPSQGNTDKITNIERGIMGIASDNGTKEAFALDSSGLFLSQWIFPNDTPNDHLDSPNRTLGVGFAVRLIEGMVQFARVLGRHITTRPTERVFLNIAFSGLNGRPLVNDTSGILRLGDKSPGRVDTVDFTLTPTARTLDALADEIVVECARRLFWVLNHDELTTGAIASLQQYIKKGVVEKLATAKLDVRSEGPTWPELQAFLRIGERQPDGYYLMGEFINAGASTLKDIRANLPRLPPLKRPEMRPGARWEIRQRYDAPILGGDYFQQGVVEFTAGHQVYRQEAIVDLSVLPGTNLRGYKMAPLNPPTPVDGYSIPE